MVFRTALITCIVAGVVGCGFDTPAPTEKLPEVFFPADRSLTDESISSTQVPVKLSMKTDEMVTVTYSVTGGSAAVGSDFNSATGEVTFQPFQDTAMLTLAIVDDGIEEPEEGIEVTLKSPKNAELGELVKHTVYISANKLPRVRFVTAASSAGEKTGAQSFAVELDMVSPEPVTVRYTWTGTSEPGDHGVVDGYITVPPNQASQLLPAVIVDDPTDEDDETLDLTMIAQSGAVIAPGLGEHVHTIIDDDLPPSISFSLTASSVSENVGTAMIAVTLGLASEKQITIDYLATAGGSAAPADFTLAAGTLTFPPGTTQLMVPVTITSDALDEDDETVRVSLANATNATLAGGGSLHTLTIADDDNSPTLAFQAASSTVGEATPTHPVTVQLSAPSGRAVQFSVTRGGTSTLADLTLPAGPFTIPAGMTTYTFNATIIDDTDDDNNETATLTLASLVNAGTGGQATHTITITDNDGPFVRFDPATPDQSAAERDLTDMTYTYRVILSSASTSTVTVPVTVGGSAMGNDYNIGSGDIPVTFQPGQTSKDIRVTVRADGSLESNETVTLTLGTPTNATSAGDNQARTHTILNDD
jgi:hypothetical protein